MGSTHTRISETKFLVVILIVSYASVLNYLVSRDSPDENLLQQLSNLQQKLEATEKRLNALEEKPGGTPLLTSPEPLPGLFLTEDKDPRSHSIYGGAGDAPHLGGFTKNDTDGQSPSLWMWMIKSLNVRSMIDVGCGRGISTKWFKDHNAEVLCVEGSNDAVKQSFLSKADIVQHDFSRGPWWPDKTYDVLWAVEFLEHVSRHYMKNYEKLLDNAALLFVTHSVHGGYHHVEVHNDWWWRARLQARGFVFSKELTTLSHAMSRISNADGFKATHIWSTLQVYINPKIARLPQHAHLFGGPGCTNCPSDKICQCEGVDKLPDRFLPVFDKPSTYDSLIQQVENGYGRFLHQSKLVVRKDYENGGRIGPVDPPH